jgi:hypothetical protein
MDRLRADPSALHWLTLQPCVRHRTGAGIEPDAVGGLHAVAALLHHDVVRDNTLPRCALLMIETLQ